MLANRFPQTVLDWYSAHGRHGLPWQVSGNAYYRWLSEIMLQQTQVTTVIPYFRRFTKRLPNIASLANAELDEVLHLWSGLGYYARARNLHRCAGIIRDRHHGEFPQKLEQVCALPGIGRSTAGAILAFGFDQRHPILDANVKRVLIRYHAINGWSGKRSIDKLLWQLAEDYTPTQSVADYNQAIMDLGATVCRPRNPRCDVCPIQHSCLACKRQLTDILPQAKPNKQRPTKATTMLLIQDGQQQVLLQQRPPVGIWGGLWSLPECPHDDIEQWCQQTLGLRVTTKTPWPTLRHSFSHFHLDITPIPVHSQGANTSVMETSPTVWYNLRQPDACGLAAPVQSLLDRMRQQL